MASRSVKLCAGYMCVSLVKFSLSRFRYRGFTILCAGLPALNDLSAAVDDVVNQHNEALNAAQQSAQQAATTLSGHKVSPL